MPGRVPPTAKRSWKLCQCCRSCWIGDLLVRRAARWYLRCRPRQLSRSSQHPPWQLLRQQPRCQGQPPRLSPTHARPRCAPPPAAAPRAGCAAAAAVALCVTAALSAAAHTGASTEPSAGACRRRRGTRRRAARQRSEFASSAPAFQLFQTFSCTAASCEVRPAGKQQAPRASCRQRGGPETGWCGGGGAERAAEGSHHAGAGLGRARRVYPGLSISALEPPSPESAATA